MVDKDGSVMNATDRFTGKEKLISIGKKRSGLIDGSLKDTPFANFPNRVAIAQLSYIESLTIGSTYFFNQSGVIYLLR